MTRYNFFDKDVWKSESQRAIDNIALYVNGNDYVKSLKWIKEHRVKNVKWIDDLIIKMEPKKTKSQEYMDSGAYQKYLDEEKEKVINARRMHKGYKKDPTITSFVKNKHYKQSGELKRIVITNDWTVTKNFVRIPLEQTIWIEVAVSKGENASFTQPFYTKPILVVEICLT